MDYHRDFSFRIWKMVFAGPSTICVRRIIPKLVQIVDSLAQVQLEDGSLHKYYGEVKQILNGFMMFYYSAIDDIVKDADRLKNLATRELLLELLDTTIAIHGNLNLNKLYIPQNAAEKKSYQEMEVVLYPEFMKKMRALRATVDELHHPADAQEFARKHFDQTIQSARKKCEFAYSYLSLMVADRVHQTRVSLQEIYNRVNTNLQIMKDTEEKELISLHDVLYSMNKESLIASRKNPTTSSMLCFAEAEKAVETMQKKIKNLDSNMYIGRVEEEVGYWRRRLEELEKVAAYLNIIKKEKDKLEEEKLYVKKCPFSDEIGRAKLAEREAYLNEKWEKEARTMLTFYACRGLDHILHKDNRGKFFFDEYKHRVFVMDHGLSLYHVTYADEFIKIPVKEYFFDKSGRYVYQAGKKVYQLAPCTSFYNLGMDSVLRKPNDPTELGMTTAEFNAKQIRKKVKDPRDVTILPDSEPIDIKHTLDKDTATYLWETFGSILPQALNDVATSKMKNPIHYLAHRLLYHRHNITKEELRKRKVDADAFKDKILGERKAKDTLKSKEYKSKQVKRRKPEESDQMQETLYDYQMAQREFIKALNYFDV